MRSSLAGIGVALVLVQMLAAPTLAATETTTVKVALTDMSSAMGGWRGTGPAGPGMMGPGMMGPGMMGRGMMAVRIDRGTVKAGAIHFDVTNWSRGMIHELLVIKVDGPNATLPYDYAQGRVAEDKVKVLADTENLEPTTSRALDVTLAPGTYMLICNMPGHFAAGMATSLTVNP